MSRFYISSDQRFRISQPSRASLAFHQGLPGYAVTPLRTLPSLAASLGLRKVLLKDESARFGLPAFKILGASWAVFQQLASEIPEISAKPRPGPIDLSRLAEQARKHGLARLVAATDGNHGRAVARVAADLGLEADIFVPAGTAPARIRGIESEGAGVIVVSGSYDDAVARAAKEQGPACWLIQDTSWPGYERIAEWVIDGYATLFWELETQLEEAGWNAPDLVLVQIGVGSLAAAAVTHFRHGDATRVPDLIGVEPMDADCGLRSLEAGEPTDAPAPHRSIMAGLNCGRIATVAWPVLRDGLRGVVAVEDEWARRAMVMLSSEGLRIGESGVAGAAALMALFEDPTLAPVRDALRLGADSTVLLIGTEGVTDPDGYERVVGV